MVQRGLQDLTVEMQRGVGIIQQLEGGLGVPGLGDRGVLYRGEGVDQRLAVTHHSKPVVAAACGDSKDDDEPSDRVDRQERDRDPEGVSADQQSRAGQLPSAAVQLRRQRAELDPSAPDLFLDRPRGPGPARGGTLQVYV